MAINKRKQATKAPLLPPKRTSTSNARGGVGKNKAAPIEIEGGTENENDAEQQQHAQHRAIKRATQKRTKTIGNQQNEQVRIRRIEDDESAPAKPSGELAKPPPAPKSPTLRSIQPSPTKAQLELDEFPIFKDGDIIIAPNADHLFQLHASTLNRAGSFFKVDAAVKVREPTSGVALEKAGKEKALLVRIPKPPPIVVTKEADNKETASTPAPVVAQNTFRPLDNGDGAAPGQSAQQAAADGMNNILPKVAANEDMNAIPPPTQRSE